MRNEIEPTITSSNTRDNETIETHPAYAQIMASRCSGQTHLYGSDFIHHNYITIKVHTSEQHRNLSRDWYHARKNLIEIKLSEAQWATFVSSLNAGGGVPCTLNYVQGVDVPDIKPVIDRELQFKQEFDKTLNSSLLQLNKLHNQVAESKLPNKTKEEFLRNLDHIKMNISSNLTFVSKSFAEHMEQTTEKAKMEVNAYAQTTLSRLGLQALQNQIQSPIQIDDEPVIQLEGQEINATG